jgi:hypothetical protein
LVKNFVIGSIQCMASFFDKYNHHSILLIAKSCVASEVFMNIYYYWIELKQKQANSICRLYYKMRGLLLVKYNSNLLCLLLFELLLFLGTRYAYSILMRMNIIINLYSSVLNNRRPHLSHQRPAYFRFFFYSSSTLT